MSYDLTFFGMTRAEKEENIHNDLLQAALNGSSDEEFITKEECADIVHRYSILKLFSNSSKRHVTREDRYEHCRPFVDFLSHNGYAYLRNAYFDYHEKTYLHSEIRVEITVDEIVDHAIMNADFIPDSFLNILARKKIPLSKVGAIFYKNESMPMQEIVACMLSRIKPSVAMESFFSFTGEYVTRAQAEDVFERYLSSIRTPTSEQLQTVTSFIERFARFVEVDNRFANILASAVSHWVLMGGRETLNIFYRRHADLLRQTHVHSHLLRHMIDNLEYVSECEKWFVDAVNDAGLQKELSQHFHNLEIQAIDGLADVDACDDECIRAANAAGLQGRLAQRLAVLNQQQTKKLIADLNASSTIEPEHIEVASKIYIYGNILGNFKSSPRVRKLQRTLRKNQKRIFGLLQRKFKTMIEALKTEISLPDVSRAQAYGQHEDFVVSVQRPYLELLQGTSARGAEQEAQALSHDMAVFLLATFGQPEIRTIIKTITVPTKVYIGGGGSSPRRSRSDDYVRPDPASGNSYRCFPGSTYVFLHGGEAITMTELESLMMSGQDIEVAGINEKTGETIYQQVGWMKTHEASPLTRIEYRVDGGDKGSVEATGNHEMALCEPGSTVDYAPAETLILGNRLCMGDVNTATITSIDDADISDGLVYDIHIENGFHNYLVSSQPDIATAITAHNKI